MRPQRRFPRRRRDQNRPHSHQVPAARLHLFSNNPSIHAAELVEHVLFTCSGDETRRNVPIEEGALEKARKSLDAAVAQQAAAEAAQSCGGASPHKCQKNIVRRLMKRLRLRAKSAQGSSNSAKSTGKSARRRRRAHWIGLDVDGRVVTVRVKKSLYRSL